MVAGEIFGFARLAPSAEPKRVLPPDTPDYHQMRLPVGARSRDPIIVRFFEALERPRPGFERGSVGGLVQCIWPEWVARFRFKHGRPRLWHGTGILAVLTVGR